MKQIKITVCENFGDGLFKELCAGFEKKFGECRIEKAVDPSLLGGFTAEFDGVIYDRSVKAGLNQLKTHIEM